MAAEIPRVSDPEANPEQVRRFTEKVAILLNALLESGSIVRGPNGTFVIPSGVGSPLTTKGDIYVFSTVNTRLAVGSDGKFLSANSTKPTGLEWVTGGSSPLTTKGDLFGHSTVDVRIPVGSDTYILTADSSNANGVSWVAPGGGGGGGADPISSIYPSFSLATDDDEFSGGSFSGWTAVNPGTHVPTVTQSNNCLSLLSTGSDALGELNAWVKSRTITTGSYVQCGLRSWGFDQTFNSAGILMADGSAYNAGAQALFYESQQEGGVRTEAHTLYKTQGATNLDAMSFKSSRTDVHLKLVYNGANSFTTLISPDGISWLTVRTQTITLTPTKAGFWVSTQGGSKAFCWCFRYVRFG